MVQLMPEAGQVRRFTTTAGGLCACVKYDLLQDDPADTPETAGHNNSVQGWALRRPASSFESIQWIPQPFQPPTVLLLSLSDKGS